MQDAPSEMHLELSATVSQTGHHGWYSMSVLAPPAMGTTGWRATRAVAAPARARRSVAVCSVVFLC